MKKKNASSTLYIIFFLVIFLAFAAFAVDGTIILTQRTKLQNITEMTALAAASEFNNPLTAPYEVHSPPCTNIAEHVSKTAQETFNLLKKDSLQTADTPINVSIVGNVVTVTTNMIAQPLFLRFLGVSGINLEAKAHAHSEPRNVQANYLNGINWLSAKAAYLSDIISKSPNMNDTAILSPLGSFPSASYDLGTSIVNFGLISAEDSQPLSLGPGGFVTIKLPVPIVDKPGPDLYIKEIGSALEGYMVFAGLDNDPNNPYVQHGNEGNGISWVNISCSGTPEDSILGANAHQTASNTNLATHPQDKFYGSGYFDFGANCVPAISMAKYIRIVDDNSESAFVNYNGSYYKAMLYGEASTATSGADIDVVKVLNYVHLE